MNNQPIIIIGMHRSGTSMLTKFIEETGVFIGHRIAKVNREAFFFQKLNDWILYQVGSTWDSPEAIEYIDQSVVRKIAPLIKGNLKSIGSISFFGFSKFILYIFNGRIKGKWGWKDPRNSLTLKIWKDIFPNAKIIHIYRNPVDVAQSLKVREDNYRLHKRLKFFDKIRVYFLRFRRIVFTSPKATNLMQGYNLWEFYVKKAFEADKMFSDTIHIKYENFLANPKKTLMDLSEFMDVSINDGLIDEIASNVSPERAYAFKKNKELNDFYEKIKNKKLVKDLGYSNI